MTIPVAGGIPGAGAALRTTSRSARTQDGAFDATVARHELARSRSGAAERAGGGQADFPRARDVKRDDASKHDVQATGAAADKRKPQRRDDGGAEREAGGRDVEPSQAADAGETASPVAPGGGDSSASAGDANAAAASAQHAGASSGIAAAVSMQGEVQAAAQQAARPATPTTVTAQGDAACTNCGVEGEATQASGEQSGGPATGGGGGTLSGGVPAGGASAAPVIAADSGDAAGQSSPALPVTSAVQPVNSGAAQAAHAAPAAAQPLGEAPVAQSSPAHAQLPLHDAQGGPDEVNVGRVARGLQAAVNQRGGTVTLRLHPPEMGFLRIEMSVKDGVVAARMSADLASARTLLQSQMGQLRQSLQAQGLSVDRLEVQTLTNTNSSSFSSQRDDSQQAGHDGRSRGRFDGSPSRDGEQRQDERGRGRPRPASFRDVMGDAAA